MDAEQRRQALMHKAHIDGHGNVVSPRGDLAVATETIRRLERAGAVRRLPGEALPVERQSFEPAVAARDILTAARVVWA